MSLAAVRAEKMLFVAKSLPAQSAAVIRSVLLLCKLCECSLRHLCGEQAAVDKVPGVPGRLAVLTEEQLIICSYNVPL